MKKNLTRKEAIEYLVEKDFEFIKNSGEDVGAYDYKKKSPPIPPDLPPGFVEFYNGNT